MSGTYKAMHHNEQISNAFLFNIRKTQNKRGQEMMKGNTESGI